MLNAKTTRSGFGTLGILSLMAAVVIIAGAGVLVYKQHMNISAKNSAHTNVGGATSPQTVAYPAVTTAVQPTPTTTAFLDIKEWKVKAPVSGSDTFTYTLSPDQKIATIASRQLADKDAACAKGGAGTIERFSPNDSISPYGGTTVQQDAQNHPGTYVHVGNYYYLFVHAQAACGSISLDDQNKANDAVKSSLAHLQTEPN